MGAVLKRGLTFETWHNIIDKLIAVEETTNNIGHDKGECKVDSPV